MLAYSLPEALWLAGGDDPVSTDVVVGYPSADRSALRRLAADDAAAARVTLMVDSRRAARPRRRRRRRRTARPALRICLDVDASLRAAGGRVHVGVRRSPVHSPADAAALARAGDAARPGFALVGLMAYEAQIAGVQDAPAAPAAARRSPSAACSRCPAANWPARRAAVVAAVSAVAPLEFVNGGGTGSVERTAAEDAVTEVAAGSGLYCPALFDGYRAFAARPAAFFAAPGDAHPGARHGDRGRWRLERLRARPGRDRLPVPTYPAGLSWLPAPRAPARCRPRCAAPGRRRCGSATGSGSGTRRPARSAST